MKPRILYENEAKNVIYYSRVENLFLRWVHSFTPFHIYSTFFSLPDTLLSHVVGYSLNVLFDYEIEFHLMRYLCLRTQMQVYKKIRISARHTKNGYWLLISLLKFLVESLKFRHKIEKSIAPS